jgi:hypothetical protein
MPKKANENLYEFIVWIWDLLSQIQQIISYLLLNISLRIVFHYSSIPIFSAIRI